MRDVCYLLRVPRWAQALNHRSLSSSVRKKLSTRTPPRIHPNLHTGGDDPQPDAGTPRESLYNHSPLRASRVRMIKRNLSLWKPESDRLFQPEVWMGNKVRKQLFGKASPQMGSFGWRQDVQLTKISGWSSVLSLLCTSGCVSALNVERREPQTTHGLRMIFGWTAKQSELNLSVSP
jgi:hypothetical protein